MKEGFYRVKRNDIPRVAEIFAKNFMKDPLYVYLCNDEKKRKQLLPLFFKHYLRYMERYGYILADSQEYHGIMLWYFSEQQPGYIKSLYHVLRLYLGGLETLKFISLNEYMDYINKFKTFGSSWIDDEAETHGWDTYVHFDMMVIDEDDRGTGLFKKLVTPCFEWLDQGHLPSTIETHNPENLPIYYKLGYQLVKEIKSEDGLLTQYCVVRNPR